MTRTLIRGSWVVGFDGAQHEIVRDGVVVTDGDAIAYVGPDRDGLAADEVVDATGMLVSPGLISTHLHANLNAKDYVFVDRGRPEALGRNYLNWQAGLEGAPRYRPDFDTQVRFALAQVLRAGATTVVEIGCAGDPERFCELADETGVRVYTGPSYRNAVMYSDPGGGLREDWSDTRGHDGLQVAVAHAEQLRRLDHDRIRPILCPGHPDTCARELLADTAAAAADLDTPVTIHAAINIPETDRTLERYRQTPVELLADCGLLATDVLLGHGVFVSNHGDLPYNWGDDLALLGAHRATVSHSPLKYLHMGYYLESFTRYTAAGVNMTVGVDFSPSDIVREMRACMLLSRVADRHFLSGTPRDVFDAATVNAAAALGRDDLGRLAPGAQADITVFDLDALHFGAVHDPVKSLVEHGSAQDVAHVWVAGRPVVRDGRLATMDEDALVAAAKAEGRRQWDDVPNWMWGGRSIDDAVPPSYPLR